MCSDRVEVTKKYYIPLRICCMKICQDLLQHPLCPSVWICAGSFRAFLSDRNKCRITIYCCRRTKDNILHTMVSHNITKRNRSANIVLIILKRLCYRLANCFQSCKMNHWLNFFFLKDLIHSFFITNVCFVEFQVFSCNLFYSFQWLFRCVV